MGLSGGEGLLVAMIALFFFGGKKLPELGKTFGASIKNFKEGLKEEDEKDKTKDKPSDVPKDNSKN
jgi:sec-independent protein translocase protein TatA